MNIDASLTTDAVLERLGRKGASDHEAEVMRTVLLELYPGQDMATLPEADWLRAFGEMNARKQTGWVNEPENAPQA